MNEMKEQSFDRNAMHSFLLYLMDKYPKKIKSIEYEEEIMDDGLFASISFSLSSGTSKARDEGLLQLWAAGWTNVVSIVADNECRIRAIEMEKNNE
jgi:hypothetical protein